MEDTGIILREIRDLEDQVRITEMHDDHCNDISDYRAPQSIQCHISFEKMLFRVVAERNGEREDLFEGILSAGLAFLVAGYLTFTGRSVQKET